MPLRVVARDATGDEVAPVGRGPPGSDCARARVAAGVLVPSSGNEVVEYDVGEAVLVRDANGELVGRPPEYGAVVLRARAGVCAGAWFWKVTVPAANGGSVPVRGSSADPPWSVPRRAVAGGVAVRPAAGGVAVRAAEGGVAVRADAGGVAVREAAGTVAVRDAAGSRVASRSVVVRDVAGSAGARAIPDLIGCVIRFPPVGRACVAVRGGITHAVHDTSA